MLLVLFEDIKPSRGLGADLRRPWVRRPTPSIHLLMACEGSRGSRLQLLLLPFLGRVVLLLLLLLLSLLLLPLLLLHIVY